MRTVHRRQLGLAFVAIAGSCLLSAWNPRARPAAGPARDPASPSAPACAPENGGITVPAGACAVVVAELPGARQIVVSATGDLYVAVQGPPGRGGVVALRDRDGDGRPDDIQRFGPSGGTGIAFRGDFLYFAPDNAVLRWRLPAGALAPSGPADTIVQDLPVGGSHTSKSIAVDGAGNLYVDVGSATNSCQKADRMLESPGIDPCAELETRAGIWRFRADRLHQRQSDGIRYATGLRNAVALSLDASGRLWAAQHGRDQLYQNWPRLYDAHRGAELPAEELLLVRQGDDFGWPYCYYDQFTHRLVLAPEYGGDGVKVGRCAGKQAPVYAFPGHWAPEAILQTRATAIAGFGNGLFIAFHGSWNRAPEPQAAGRVLFLPLDGDRPGTPVSFAEGFAGAGSGGGEMRYRPDGLAQGPDGSIYISSDVGGRLWRVVPRQ